MELTVVTSNDGKFAEFAESLDLKGLNLTRRREAYPEIQADRLEEVVAFGMQWLRSSIQGDFVIDDSGIFIDSIAGFPGVYSSYVYRTIGLDGILRLLTDDKERSAIFSTVLGLFIDGKESIIKGNCHGSITLLQRGEGGFGYDPLFVPDGEDRTFAQMELSEKNKVSHRGEALRKLGKILEEHLTAER